jgi:pimeloyl-ACP methyl ester carboxylesterase
MVVGGILALGAVFGPAADAAATAGKPGLEAAECWFKIPKLQKARCGYLTVPENHAKPSGRMVRLPVVIIEATSGKSKADPVVFLTGGPGQAIGVDKAGIEQWWAIAEYWPWTRSRDLILFEQRGNGMSEPGLNCTEADERGSEFLQSLNDRDRIRKIYSEAIAACRARLVAEGIDPDLYGTRDTVKDLTALRRALRIKQWNLLGVSYGTRLALAAMRDAPEGIRSVILDSPYPPEIRAYESMAEGVDAAFRRLFETCANSQYCKVRYPNLEKAIFEHIEILDTRPIQVTIADPRDGSPLTIDMTGDTFVELTRYSLAFSDSRFSMPAYLDAVAGVDAPVLESIMTGMVDQYFGFGTDDFSEGKYFAVECVEEIPFNDPARVREQSEKYRRFAGFGYQLEDLAACEAWPKEELDAGLKAPIESRIPTLVLSGQLDPITPVEYGRTAASRLANGYFFEVPRRGHSLVTTSECAIGIAHDFVDKPQVKPNGACLEKKERY